MPQRKYKDKAVFLLIKTDGKPPEEGDGTMSKSHGLSTTPEYKIWQLMKDRCFNPNYRYFHRYGGRGITVSKEWMEFQNFWNDMCPRPSKALSIDRIDNNGSYCKENCRWATVVEQRINRGQFKTNTSGTKGVLWHKGTNKWQARVGVGVKYIHLGVFAYIEDAIKAREDAEKLYFPEKL